MIRVVAQSVVICCEIILCLYFTVDVFRDICSLCLYFYASKMLLGPQKSSKVCDNQAAKPYCQCFKRREPCAWKQLNICSCGEDVEVSEWKWQEPDDNSQSWVVFADERRQVTFHPYYSSGTAAVRGDSALERDRHYYWEVKMLSETYGTDIMVGVGTDKVNIVDSRFRFTSLLGEDEQSYGLSYRGAVRHDAVRARESAGFCRGTIVGVRVDMWQGTLEFYLNRKPQGISFYNLRRHPNLFPMICSTAAQSSMRLIYAASWRASLLVDAAKILATSLRDEQRADIPPGLLRMFRPHFWLLLPTENVVPDKEDDVDNTELDDTELNSVHPPPGFKRRHWQMTRVPVTDGAS